MFSAEDSRVESKKVQQVGDQKLVCFCLIAFNWTWKVLIDKLVSQGTEAFQGLPWQPKDSTALLGKMAGKHGKEL